MVGRIADDLGRRWSGGEHVGCDASCPDCLRSYDNRHLHPVLDWRLALDVADLCLGRPLALGRWMDLGGPTARAFADTYGEALAGVGVQSVGAMTALVCGDRAVLLSHPLWRVDQAGWCPAQREAVEELRRTVSAVSMLDLRRARSFPESIYQLLVQPG